MEMEKMSMRAPFQKHRHVSIAFSAALALANLLMPLAFFVPTAHAATTFGARLAMPSNTLGLTAHWTFDGGDLITNVKDASGQGNNGFLVGFTSTSSAVSLGMLGQALSFNGSTQYISTSYTVPALSSGTSFTWSAWMKLNSGNSNTVVILGFRNGATWVKLTPTAFEYGSGSLMSHSIPTGSWVHIVIVKSGSNFTYYQNGASIATASNSGSVVSHTFFIGADPDFSSDGKFSGTVDDVRVYGRALSAAEVTQMYQQGNGTGGSQIKGCGFGTFLPGSNKCRGFITSGSTWTVPKDWSSTNTIEAIGAGGNGGGGAGAGGGGGAYAAIANQALTPSSSISVQIGVGGGGPGSTGDTYLKNNSGTTVLLARGGATPSTTTGGAGGDTAGSIGSTKYAGGAGGGHQYGSGGGGGGSAGPSGAGKAGGRGGYQESGGAGGGGSNGGSSTAGTDSSGYSGYAGGNGTGGTGGGAGGVGSGNPGSPGTAGGGGGGGVNGGLGGAGGSDTAFDATHGAGGGGGGNGSDVNTTAAGAGGTYGGGGGGGGHYSSHTSTGGTGGQGLLVVTYTPSWISVGATEAYPIAATINTTPTPPNLATGLVGHWTFDGANLVSNVRDSSVTGNNGRFTGITSTSSAVTLGILGQALKFSANNQGVTVTYNSAYNWGSTESVSAWIYLTQTQQQWARVYKQSASSGSGLNLELDSSNKPKIQINGTTITSSNALQLNRWYLYTETYDGVTAKIYINDVLDKSQALTGTIADYNEPLIFAKGAGGTEQFYGIIDDIRAYNRVLSANEIKQLYALGH